MALIPKLRPEEIEQFGDICHNLPSIQFESALSEDESKLLYLRKRSHALTVYTAAQATYFASLFNESRQIERQLKLPQTTMVARMFQTASQVATLVGIIGCGRMGSHIAHCLLTFGEFSPQEIKISTRRPETLAELTGKGVTCCFDNKKVAAAVHLLFLCVLPSQFPVVAEEIKSCISDKCVVYALMSATPLPRVIQLLDHKQVILPDHQMDKAVADSAEWDYTLEVTGAFAEPTMLEQTCPVSRNKEGAVVATDEKFFLQMLYAIINYLSKGGLPKLEVTNLINAIILGHSEKTPQSHFLSAEDIQLECKSNATYFDETDLADVASRDLFLGSVIMENMELRQLIIDQYCSLFQHYLEWKNQALQLSKKQANLDKMT